MISLIVCMDRNGLIGNGNALPWHLPADLSYFKKKTLDNFIVMGRKTYESIGKPLPNRFNIILTRNKENLKIDKPGEYSVVSDYKFVLDMNVMYPKTQFFIIGGTEIFNLFYPYAETLYITKINAEFEGDCYFPKYNENDWDLISRIVGPRDSKNPYEFTFNIYEKRYIIKD